MRKVIRYLFLERRNEMVDFSYRDKIINKLLNGERLTNSQISHIERLLTLDEYYTDILDVKIGIEDQNLYSFKIIKNKLESDK